MSKISELEGKVERLQNAVHSQQKVLSDQQQQIAQMNYFWREDYCKECGHLGVCFRYRALVCGQQCEDRRKKMVAK